VVDRENSVAKLRYDAFGNIVDGSANWKGSQAHGGGKELFFKDGPGKHLIHLYPVKLPRPISIR
jgi:hypothetical protein